MHPNEEGFKKWCEEDEATMTLVGRMCGYSSGTVGDAIAYWLHMYDCSSRVREMLKETLDTDIDSKPRWFME